jgi:hypothetical protein
MVATPQSSQEQGMTWNNSYVVSYPWFNPLNLFPIARDEQRASVGELLTTVKYLIQSRQSLHFNMRIMHSN